MSLTIDQVRDSRFHLARRNGYEPVDVDNFVDQVEETLVELNAEIDRLKAAGPAAGAASGDDDAARARAAELEKELEDVKAQLAEARHDADEKGKQLTVLGQDLEASRAGGSDETKRLQSELEAQRGQVATLTEQLNDYKQQLAAKDAELADKQRALVGAQSAAPAGDGDVKHLVLTAAPEASAAVTRLLEMATKQADDLVSGAQNDAERIRREADDTAARIRREADDHAGRVNWEAAQRKDQLENEYNNRRTELENELAGRRHELNSGLERDHADLQDRVGQLRDYEAKYRNSMVEALLGHVEALKQGAFDPEKSK